MKISVRSNVFETNSSSTHSLTIENGTVDDARKAVNEKIRKAYSNASNDDGFDEAEYIQGHSLMLRGICLRDGDEARNVYYIISNWMAKIQYMAMFLANYVNYIEGCNGSNVYACNNAKLLQESQVYKDFIGMALGYAIAKGYSVTDVKYDMEYLTWIEDFDGSDAPNISFDGKIMSKETIENMFINMMQDDRVVTYCDEAYNPYEGPEIYVL